MTTSGGGMLLSDDGDLIAHARKLSTQAREPVPWYEHVEIGYNYRLSNLLAAFGRAQLSRLPAMIERRRAIRSRYAAALADTGRATFLGGPDSEDNCWLTGIVLSDEAAPEGVTPDPRPRSTRRDIEARHLWRPMHLQPVFAATGRSSTGSSEEPVRLRGLLLPSGSALHDDDLDRVIEALTRPARGVATMTAARYDPLKRADRPGRERCPCSW